MRKLKPFSLILLILLTAVLGWGWLQCVKIGDHLQYIVKAPDIQIYAPADTASQSDQQKQQPNYQLLDAEKSLAVQMEELADSIDAWTLFGEIQRKTLSANDSSAESRIVLCNERCFELKPQYVLTGRLFYPEEMKRGDKLILLDEQLALELFRISDPVDQTVKLGSVKYRVVGILRHTRQVGDRGRWSAYIPMNSLIPEEIQVDALIVEAKPVQASGAAASFSRVMEKWMPDGTSLDLGKESMGAWLWLRLLLFAAGLGLVIKAINLLCGWTVRRYRVFRFRLRRDYAARLLPWTIGNSVMIAAGFLLCIAALAVLMRFILEPVYIFPEWVPAVIVEWKEIQKTFWNVWQSGATLLEWRTQELLRIRWLTLLIDAASAVTGVIFFSWFSALKSEKERALEALRFDYDLKADAVFVSGADQARIRASGLEEIAEAGYIRILRVQETLERVLPSKKTGSFVLRVTDDMIPENNRQWRITCDGETNQVKPCRGDWDVLMSVQAMAAVLYGSEGFRSAMENRGDITLKIPSEAMDGFFAQKLLVGKAGSKLEERGTNR